jgi:thiosulfate/3-mercaptopyruvate sulfurtransferase
MAEPFGPLVSAEWLREHLGDPDLRIIDLRWYLDGRSGLDAFHAGHIPGARFMDLQRDVTGTDGPGRHPLPTASQFAAAMRTAGLNGDSRVVVYDDQGGFSAARLWWLLGYYGHRAQAVLDGGLAAWQDPLETMVTAHPAGNFEAKPAATDLVVDREGVRGSGAKLIDARARERFTGEVEPIDPKAGHIPGAHNLPWRDNLGDDWRFLPPEVLRRRYQDHGATAGADVIVYCGSGVSACVDLLAMDLAGLRGARLYAGSWSDWSSQDLPVETGEGAAPTR